MPHRAGKSIEWATHVISPVKGLCPYIIETGGLEGNGGCPYCYTKGYFNRFKNSRKPLNPKLRRDTKEMYWVPPKHSKVAVCLNLDLFHPSVPDKWKRQMIARTALQAPDSTFIYLTKRPQEYNKFRFPINSWLGATWDGLEYTSGNLQFLANVDTHCLKFVSFEPLLERPPEGLLDPFKRRIKWIIIGFDSTRGIEKSPLWWVSELIEQARDNDMAVWVKNNTGHSAALTTKEYPVLF